MNEPTTVVDADDRVVEPEPDRRIVDLTYLLDESQDRDLLVRHAGHPHPWVRQTVAGNPATPTETVAALASDNAPVVRRNAAITCTDPFVLRVLSRDPDPVTARTARATLRRLARRTRQQHANRS